MLGAQMTPFQIRIIDHVVLKTEQIDTMVAFYRDVLGCEVERRIDAGITLVQLRAGDSLIDLLKAPRDGENQDHFCLAIDPFDEAAIRAHLAKHNVEATPTAQLYGAAGVGPSIYLSDPEGNRVELKGPSKLQT